MTDTATLPAEVTQDTMPPAKADIEPKSTPPQGEPAGKSDASAAAENGQLEPQEELSEAEKRRKERNKERWREMNRTREDAVRRAANAEAEVQRLRSMIPADYSQISDPDEALAERTAAKLREGQASDIERRAKAEREAAREAMFEAFEVQKEEMRQSHPDFDDVFSRAAIHRHAAPFIASSEKGGELAYWLGQNPKEAHALYDTFERNPARALIELGRLEARVSTPPAKKTSTAPPPAATLSGGRSPPVFDPSAASTNDFAELLKKAGII